MQVTNNGRIKEWTDGVPVEDAAREQLLAVSSLPFIYKHIAVMPDCHAGAGSTIGSVIATRGAVIPAAVGVDIGCGMTAMKTNLDIDDLSYRLNFIRGMIEQGVPHGRTDNGGEDDVGSWKKVPTYVKAAFGNDSLGELSVGLENIVHGDPELRKASGRALRQLGTLGTGNHFIEVCVDLEDQVWIVLHSGSRGIGNAIGQHFIRAAKAEMGRYFITPPTADLSYLVEGTAVCDRYLNAAAWAQRYAKTNRRLMLMSTITAIGLATGHTIEDKGTIDCHHNYIDRENHFGANVLVTRKGAVRAREGDWGIIPGSMGARTFIVKGKGDRQSFSSCSHGAGRAMSRTAARKLFTVEDHVLATAGIECRKDESVLDETPGAYKDINAVMAAQANLISVEGELRQLVCVKG